MFKSEIGKMISGTISPAVAGVKIRATLNESEAELPIVLNAETDFNGFYKYINFYFFILIYNFIFFCRIGPVWNLNNWKISLLKEGYEFKQIKNNHFKSIKLSHLKILFADIDSNKPLQDVIVSISGPKSYRLNEVTNVNGITVVIGLVEFYLYII